ncbi:MAG: aminotransferase class IV [Ferruginibacter sp.]|nr:aminotransferase class IV [Ferruginibacter sp.]
MIAFVNNYFLDEDKATLQIGDLAIHRGYGVFDFFRIRNNVPLFLDDYLDRFFSSAALMRLQPNQTRDQLTAIIFELILKNNLGESGVKLILTGGYSPDSYEPVAPNLVILQQKLQVPQTGSFTTGVKVITHEYQRDLPSVKSINYLMGVWLQQKVKEQHAADVLYYKHGVISELPRANVFMVTQDQRIVTPSHNILYGITRKKLLELAATKYTTELRSVDIEEIKNAAEVFMTSTTKRLLPITQLDDVVIGNGKAGPVTRLLNTAFINMEEELLQNELRRV